jgi:pimeloyl-ACP methyl ester carboxylesterase/DNA-binding CsgD family transcriptional regulator
MPEFSQQIRFCKSADGTRIAYAVSGSGPAVVWVQHWVHHHEFDLRNPIWRGWLSALASGRTLIRFDWRGCGLSDRTVDFSMDALKQDLEAVIDAAAIDRCALFGMAGAGSGIAMTYTAEHPDKVAGLVLQEPHVTARLAGQPSAQQVAEANARLKVIEIGWANDTPAYRDFFTALHIPDASPAQTSAYNQLLRQTTNADNALKLLRSFWSADFIEVAKRVARPTIVFHARGDSVIPFEQGRQLAGIIPGAEFVPLQSKNHLLLNTEPAWSSFVQALNQFLSLNLADDAHLDFGTLTSRERDVLALLARGSDNNAIASSLRISEKTVRNHVSAIFGKLGVSSRAEAVAKARDASIFRRSA